MRSPLVWVAFFLSLGIWISSNIRIPILFVLSAAVFSLVISSVAIRRRIPSFAALSAAFFFIGCLLFQARQILPADHIKNFTPAGPREVYLEGLVVDEPVIAKTFYGGKKINLTLEAGHLQRDRLRYAVTGRVKVSLTGERSFSYGDRIVVNGRLSRPRGPLNPGGFDYAGYLERNRIFSVLGARAQDAVILERDKGQAVLSLAYKVRGKIGAIISGGLPGESANFLNAILLGLRQEIGNDLSDAFMRTGTIQVLARQCTKFPSFTSSSTLTI